MDSNQRQKRITRAKTEEFQKIEIISHDVDDVDEIEIDIRILNKLKQKMNRRG